MIKKTFERENVERKSRSIIICSLGGKKVREMRKVMEG